MRARVPAQRLLPLLVLALALALPGAAAAANVVNGDFEAGLQGWGVHRATEAGNWFAYKGTAAPIGSKRGADPVQAPPQGEQAAIADEANPDTLVLYQDVELATGLSHQLSLLAFYDSYKPIAVPTPDSLSVSDEVLLGQPNQQFRIDVIRPGAPLESLESADVLSTVFQTGPGSRARMKPTKLTADLSSFGGQTVRLRIVVAAHEEVLNAGVDAVAISSVRGSGPGGSSRLGFGKPKPNRKTGTVLLPVRVPGTGLLSVGKRKVIRSLTVKAAEAKTVMMRLRPTAATRQRLERRQKLRVTVVVTFLPAGEPRETATVRVVLELRPPRRG